MATKPANKSKKLIARLAASGCPLDRTAAIRERERERDREGERKRERERESETDRTVTTTRTV